MAKAAIATGHQNDAERQPLSAEAVVQRPFACWDKGEWDLSRWDDPVGGVTLNDDRQLDVLLVVKRAAEFGRRQIVA